MGEGESKEKSSSDYGSIYIQTDAPYFLAGQVVTGKIYLNIFQHYPAAFLDIQVKGKEKVKWHEWETHRKSDGETETRRVKRKGEHKILYTRIPLFTFADRVVAPGQYCFPFQFQLANGIPGSLIISNDELKAEIKYSVKGIIEPWKDTHIKKMKSKQLLIVREPVPAEYGDMHEDTSNVTSCCCFGKGSAKVKASFEKNFYSTQETAKCTAWVDNSECSVPVSHLDLQLRMHIDLNAHHHHKHYSKVIVNREYPGLAAGDKVKDDECRYLELNLFEYKHELKPRKNKEWGKQELAFGHTIPPNSSGQRARLWYTLEVAPKYDDLICCTSQPRVDLPMFVVPDSIPMYGQVPVPEGWNPQVYEQQNFMLQDQAQVPRGQLPPHYAQLYQGEAPPYTIHQG